MSGANRRITNSASGLVHNPTINPLHLVDKFYDYIPLQLIINADCMKHFLGLVEIGTADMTSNTADSVKLFDGNSNTIAHSEIRDHEGGFTITLNLKHVARITKIRVYNRVDCCQERILGFKVIIKDHDETEVNCGTIEEENLQYDFVCEGIGYKVELKKEGTVSTVNLAEVEIYGGKTLIF